MQFKMVIGIVSAMLIAIFALQNAVNVGITLFAWHFETSLVLVIFGAAALGALCIGVLSFLKQVGVGMRIWDQQSTIRKLEGEIKQLKKDSDYTHGIIAELKQEKIKWIQERDELLAMTAELKTDSVTIEAEESEELSI